MKTRNEWYDDFCNYRNVYGRKNYNMYNVRTFLNWCDKKSPLSPYFSQELFDEWCAKRSTEKYSSQGNRIGLVNTFIKFINKRSEDEHYYETTISYREKSAPPVFFEEEEVRFFFKALDELPMELNHKTSRKTALCIKLRAVEAPVFFRLMYATGTRPMELRELTCSDVDLDRGTIFLRQTKGYCERLIAVDQSVVKMLMNYERYINEIIKDRSYYFPNHNNEIHPEDWYLDIFRYCWDKYNLPREGRKVIPYSFRHNFIIQNILSWNSLDPDIEKKMIILSKYVGHSTINKTMYYMHYVPKFYEILQDKCDERINRVIPNIDKV